MPKQVVARVLEDILGEYILNISKNNLKVGILRGSIKLDDVQLDGDLIGSHILGAVGLSGFGVLSCWARKLKISVSWSSLEKEPTRIEITGMHLICVPLLSSTATLQFGSGTTTDPRCSLRTRAKRSALARFERNFFAGRIEGEGPRASATVNGSTDGKNIDEKDENVDHNYDIDDDDEKSKRKDTSSTNSRPNWRTRLKAKIFKNVEASIRDVHIRCEVPKNAIGHFANQIFNEKHTDGHPNSDESPPDQRAFSFGFTLGSFVVKTATRSWDTGTIKETKDIHQNSAEQGNELPPASENSYKVIEVNNMAIYWDDDPPFLISDSFLSKENLLTMSQEKMQKNIASVMDAMQHSQDPGDSLRHIFHHHTAKQNSSLTLEHQYVILPFSLQCRATLTTISLSNLRSCFVELLPGDLKLLLRPYQLLQYTKLKNAMFAQQRLDTMLHKRPANTPSPHSKNSRAWWHYTIACVITRPNSRPWRDVIRIVRARPRYIELIIKKIFFASKGNGYHCGLNEEESVELLQLEDLLPIEALLAFHLVALRDVLGMQLAQTAREEAKKYAHSRSSNKSPARYRNKSSLSRLRRALGGIGLKGRRGHESWDEDMEDRLLPALSHSNTKTQSGELFVNSGTVINQMYQAAPKEKESPPMQLCFKVHGITATCSLLDKILQKPIVKIDVQTDGQAQLNNSITNELTFNINRFDILDCLDVSYGGLTRLLQVAPPKTTSNPQALNGFSTLDYTSTPKKDLDKIFARAQGVEGEENDLFKISRIRKLGIDINNTSEGSNPITADKVRSKNMHKAPPPPGVVCQVYACTCARSVSLGISAHPATFVFKKDCIQAIADFFTSSSPDIQTILNGQLRNVATPLAHKAQLALMSPLSLFVDLNVDAPKLWIPVSSKSTDGALFLDAGRIRMNVKKEEFVKDTNWEVDVSEIQVKFNKVMPGVARKYPGGVSADGEELPIVQPFHISMFASIIEPLGVDSPSYANPGGSVRNEVGDHHEKFRALGENASKFNIIVGKISLSLIDVDVIAKAIGRWYANEIARRTYPQKINTAPATRKQVAREIRNGTLGSGKEKINFSETLGTKDASHSFQINANVEQIELTLESLATVTLIQEEVNKSTSTSPSLAKVVLPKRIYMISFVGLNGQYRKGNLISLSRLSVDDISVIQRKQNSSRTPLKGSPSPKSRRPVINEPRHVILIRAPDKRKGLKRSELSSDSLLNLTNSMGLSPKASPGIASSHSYNPNAPPVPQPQTEKPILSACHLHDGKNHLDEVEIDIESVILRITPTSLRDFLHCTRRILEIIQLMTREMERKVHEKGRKARGKKEVMIEKRKTVDVMNENILKAGAADSSILFRVVLKETIILAGRPILESSNNSRRQRLQNDHQAADVIQVLSNTLVMFQSVEEASGSGKKTLHLSIEDLSASLSTRYEPVSISDVPPLISPTVAEFRIVYTTENQGAIVSQDFSLDCDTIKGRFTPDDIKTVSGVCRKMIERLKSVEFDTESEGRLVKDNNARCVSASKKQMQAKSRVIPILQFKKKGSGIASKVRLEFQAFSLVLLRGLQVKNAGRPLFDLNVNQTKGKFEGCISAMSGECSAKLSMNFFNTWISEWEYVVEPCLIVVALEQMPNEFNLSVASPDIINMNLTGVFLSDLAEMNFGIFRPTRKSTKGSSNRLWLDSKISTPKPTNLGSMISKGPDSPSVLLVNESGVDIIVRSMPLFKSSSYTSQDDSTNTFRVANWKTISLDSCFTSEESQNISDIILNACPSFSLELAQSAQAKVGKRDPILNLPLTTKSGYSIMLYKLLPTHSLMHQTENQSPSKGDSGGRCKSPETCFSEATGFREERNAFHDYEPVVEWCIQNQRLRASTVDVYSIEKGKDMLSSQIWSPSEDYYFDLGQISRNKGPSKVSSNLSRDVGDSFDSTENLLGSLSSTRSRVTGNWLRPYLKNDVPEWTDMTYVLRLERERVMLPDPNWIWVNEWTVDYSGVYGDTTDGDGWEYSVDFNDFNRFRRFYRRGDACRRRRWTRTRIVKPPRLDDPRRPLSIVWETKRKDDGSFLVVVRSPLSIHNSTSIDLSLFACSYSWINDQYVACIAPGETKSVPIDLSSATYIRLARKKFRVNETKPHPVLDDYELSERIMILPTSHNSTSLARTSVFWSDGKGSPMCSNFLIQIKCVQGLKSIHIEPVLQIINLLPCQVQCKLGESSQSGGSGSRNNTDRKHDISEKEICVIETSECAKVLSVNPLLKPHISLRLPGYKWSLWQRIVNREATSETWLPTDKEEVNIFEGDTEHATEFKSIVRFDRIIDKGDPLVIIISVESGHCPVIRIWAQYWILDKTGFGLRFADTFTGLLGNIPAGDSCRRSYLTSSEAKHEDTIIDMDKPGHQWSLGMSGMSLYFSRKEKVFFRIESGAGDDLKKAKGDNQIKSGWSSSMDVSNVMPKTVFSLEEHNGPRRFELSLNVSLCPSIFSRSKLITVFPRYQIVNLLNQTIFVAQDGCLQSETVIPSQTAVPFHWDVSSLAPKVRLSLSSEINRSTESLWTNGCIRLDKVGITSMRLPTPNQKSKKPMVIQAEVRLATPQQSTAVVIVIWSANEGSNPLYLLRNKSSYTILCSQHLDEENPYVNENTEGLDSTYESLGNSKDLKGKYKRRLDSIEAFGDAIKCYNNPFEISTNNVGQADCATLTPWFGDLFRTNYGHEFIWRLPRGEVMCFGFEDPEKPLVLKWTCVDVNHMASNNEAKAFAAFEVNAMGSNSILTLVDGRQISCQMQAEHSTKVIEFTDIKGYTATADPPIRRSIIHEFGQRNTQEIEIENDSIESDVEDEFIAVKFRLDLLGIGVSVVDNLSEAIAGREILYFQSDSWMLVFSQTREGYHEIEVMLMSLQVDAHVFKAAHPVLLFCPRIDEKYKSKPFLHMSAVRRLQPHSSTYVFRYAALRILELDIFLDRRTAETIAQFVQPLQKVREEQKHEIPQQWVTTMTSRMASKYAKPNRRAPRDIEKMALSANSGRIYFEQLHLHPIRLSLTFTQEWTQWNPATEGMVIFQFIRGMASITSAPLTFTSFVVNHAFEAPQAYGRIIGAHYSSQLTKQIFGILGSLAILGAPADFLANVGTGVRDFFYEPINGIIHGPQQFIEGLEAGTQSLARGLVVGVVRGAANVTDVVNSNLAGLTADDEFIDERDAHRRMLADALSRGTANRTVGDSLNLAGASITRGVKSGALGMIEQPTRYASRYGPVGLLKGVGKALVGAVVKPVVGVGDAAVLMMNHVSEATSDKAVLLRIPKRLRRALPRISVDRGQSVQLVPFDEKAARAQKIVTAGESVDDIYIGYVHTVSHLIIASEQCLWFFDRNDRKPWCLSWEEVSHFAKLQDNVMKITVFSQTGLKPYIFKAENGTDFAALFQLLSMQVTKMGNCPSNFVDLDKIMSSGDLEDISSHDLPGIKTKQMKHLFGSINTKGKALSVTAKDDIEIIEQCYGRVKKLGSDLPVFFKYLDEEAWTLVSSWGQVYRRCVAAGLINGSGHDIQVKSTMLIEGGSPCYAIPSKEYDQEQGLLGPGGALILFGWGISPNLEKRGSVFMNIETSAFVCDLSDRKSRATYVQALSGFQVDFLEKSYDENGWWAKYWLLVRKA